jgi:two-component system KDP operon response regulator KdpE
LPIIVLSVRDSERDKVQALNKGADDYLAKPFYIDELVARIRVALRHSAQAQVGANPKVTVGDLVIDLAAHTITKSGQDVKLTATEFKLLAYLVSHSGRVLTHQSILTHVWGIEYMDNVEYLRVYISQLRKKLENDPQQPHWLISEPGVGYRFSLNE